MKLVFNRADLIDAGWDLEDSDSTVVARHDALQCGASPVSMTLTVAGDTLQLPYPDVEAKEISKLRQFLLETYTRCFITN